MKYVAIIVGLFLALYIEVIFFHFPLFFLVSSLILLVVGERVLASVIFLLSLVLDSLMVHIFGVTALFLFVYVFALRLYFVDLDFRGRMLLVVSLLLTSVLYSMVVGYPVHLFFYFLAILSYGLFEYVYRCRSSHDKLIPWV